MKKLVSILTLALWLFPVVARAAIPAGAIWEINAGATANNVNGGFFNPGATFTITDFAATSATGNSPVVTSATYTFVAGDDEAWVYVSSAGASTWVVGRFCRIDSVAGGAATLSAAIGACVDYSSTTRIYTVSTTAGIATTASPTGGTLGIDYSRTAAAPFFPSDLASSNGDTNPCDVTSATVGFAANHIGNAIHINSGTNWTATWYHIPSVSAGAARLDKACASAASVSSGTFRLGGALSMGSTLDLDVLQLSVAGNDWFVRNNGTVTLGEQAAITAAGGAQNPIRIIGYNTIRGDAPTGTNMPDILAASGMNLGAVWHAENFDYTSSAAAGLQLGTSSIVQNVKSTNNSTTANRAAFTLNNGSQLINSEAVSYRGNALEFAGVSNQATVIGSYIHDSNCGVESANTTGSITFISNIFTSFVTCAVTLTGSTAARASFINNTFHGWNTPLGTGVNMTTTVENVSLRNNIITGFVNGIDHADTQSAGVDNYNDYYNNTEDIDGCGATASCATWQKGPNDISTNPSFTSVGYVNGATATTSGSDLVQAGANLSTVVAGRDYLYLVSGTGVTAGIYGITGVNDGTDTITLDIAPGTDATGDKVWQITTGRNFLPTVTLAGFPGAFQGGYTTGNTGIGAAQRATSSGGGGGIIGQ